MYKLSWSNQTFPEIAEKVSKIVRPETCDLFCSAFGITFLLQIEEYAELKQH